MSSNVTCLEDETECICSKREWKININKSHSESKSNGIYITENRKERNRLNTLTQK